MRAALLLLGAGTTAYGAWLLLDLGTDNVVAAATWLVGGVVLHDAVLAPLVVLLSLLALGHWRAPLAAGLLLLGTLTLAAVPVLLARGRRPDNPTLLDRDYWLGWWTVTALIALGVLLTELATSYHRRTHH